MKAYIFPAIDGLELFDNALIHNTTDLRCENRDKKKAILLRELVTTEGNVNEALLSFMAWLLSDNERELFLSKKCNFKCLHFQADTNKLKILIGRDSRCTVHLIKGYSEFVNRLSMKWLRHVESNYGFHRSVSMDSFGIDSYHINCPRRSNSFSSNQYNIKNNLASKPFNDNRNEESDIIKVIRSFETQLEDLRQQFSDDFTGSNREKLTQMILKLKEDVQKIIKASDALPSHDIRISPMVSENLQEDDPNQLEDPQNSSTCTSHVTESTNSSTEDSLVNESLPHSPISPFNTNTRNSLLTYARVYDSNDREDQLYLSGTTLQRELDEALEAVKHINNRSRSGTLKNDLGSYDDTILDITSSHLKEENVHNKHISKRTSRNEKSVTIRDQSSIEIDVYEDGISYFVDSNIAAFDSFNNNKAIMDSKLDINSNEFFTSNNSNRISTIRRATSINIPSQTSSEDIDNNQNEMAADTRTVENPVDRIFSVLLLYKSFNTKSAAVFEGEMVMKRLTAEYYPKNRFMWIDLPSLTLNWTKSLLDKNKKPKANKYILLKRLPGLAASKGIMRGVEYNTIITSEGFNIQTEAGWSLIVKIPRETMACWVKVIKAIVF